MNRFVILFALAALPAFAQFEAAISNALPCDVVASNVEVRAASPAAAAEGLQTVLRLNDEVCALLNVTSPPPRLVAWFTAGASWTNFLRRAGIEPEGRSMVGGHFIAVLVAPDDPGESLAHELIHATLKNTSPGPLPLWFEEGMACHYGWLAAKNAARAQGRDLMRTLPELDEKALLDFEALLAAGDYPHPPAANRSFYRQSEELVGLLAERLGAVGLQTVARGLARGEPLRDWLKKELGYSDASLRRLERAVTVRSTVKQRR